MTHDNQGRKALRLQADMDACTQHIFERVMFEKGEELAATADVLHGIAQTRRTLTAQLVENVEQDSRAGQSSRPVEQDIGDYARV